MSATAMDLQPLVSDEEYGVASEIQTAHVRSRRRGIKVAAAGSVAAALLLATVKMRSAFLSEPAEQAPTAFVDSLLQAYSDLPATVAAAKQYNETIAAAMAVLGKIAYCDDKPGVYGSAAYSCGKTGLPGVRTACEEGGFTVVPGSVKVVQAPGTSALVTSLQPSNQKLAFLKAYAIVFRGSVNSTLEKTRDGNSTLVPLDSLAPGASRCPSASVHAGYYNTWKSLRESVLTELRHLGAFVTCTGHGSGAALCSYAMLELKSLGFQVMSSYTFSMPAPGNQAFATCFNKEFGGLTPLFRITHAADRACSLPAGKDYAFVGAEVHYPSLTRGLFSVCQDGDATCGCAKYAQDTKWSGNATCQTGLAPEGSFCNFESFTSTCYGGTGFHWSAFGPSSGGGPQPTVVGLSDLSAPGPSAANQGTKAEQTTSKPSSSTVKSTTASELPKTTATTTKAITAASTTVKTTATTVASTTAKPAASTAASTTAKPTAATTSRPTPQLRK